MPATATAPCRAFRSRRPRRRGFSEGQVAFRPAPKVQEAEPDPERLSRVTEGLSNIENDDLRAALEALARKVVRD